MSLNTLKIKLQECLNESTESGHFQSAIEDGRYSTDCGVTALEQWIAIWTQTDSHCLTESEMEYQECVQFVADTWDKIKGEEFGVSFSPQEV